VRPVGEDPRVGPPIPAHALGPRLEARQSPAGAYLGLWWGWHCDCHQHRDRGFAGVRFDVRGQLLHRGAWYTNTAFPLEYRNTYFHADYGAVWIKSFVFDINDRPVRVQDFAGNAGGVVFVAVEPQTGHLYYIAWTSAVRRIRYLPGANTPPAAVAAADETYGPAPLTVQFSGTGSTDPEGQALAYHWDFGDGSLASTAASPLHTFSAPAGVPRPTG